MNAASGSDMFSYSHGGGGGGGGGAFGTPRAFPAASASFGYTTRP